MYQKKISKANPGLIQFLLDDSGSTADSFPGTTDPVFKWNERYVGIMLKELLARSTEVQGGQAKIKPRYYTSFIEYGTRPNIWNEEVMDIEATVKQYTEGDNSLGLGGLLGGTDAEAAFKKAYEILSNAVKTEKFKNSFPPMLFHLTDGLSATDATQVANKIEQLSTSDGNVLVVNAFIGTQTSLKYKDPEDFPGYTTEQEAGPSPDNIRLFNMSSEMPEAIYMNLVDDGIFPKLRKSSRLFFDVRSKEQLKNVIQVVGSIGSRSDRTEK